MKIMIVEDDLILARELQLLCVKWNFQAKYLEDFKHVDQVYCTYQPDLILLDINLPFYDGFYWCQKIRENSTVPILFISSREQNADKILALSAGGDDYIEKPFRIKVLLAKIQSVLKRAGKWNQTISLNDSILNLNQQTLTIEETTFSLSISEVAIVESLFSKHPNYVSRQDLAKAIYSKTNHETSLATVSTRVSELNSKLNGKYIESSRNKGYRWIL